jgi:hypothetical protein
MEQQSYGACVETSERVAWTADKVFAGRRADLSKRMLPDALACIDALPMLSSDEKLWLNQIRGHSYAYLFYFIEEAILEAVFGRIRASRGGNAARLRALLRFADEEVKHQQVFLRFCKEFREDFGIPCGLLGSRATAEDVATTLNKSPPLAVMLVLLHIEWVSQRHYVECVRSATGLDPLFVDLLRYHWIEEAQHTKVDLLLLREIVDDASREEIEMAIDVYLELGKAIDGLLYQQMELDVETFEKKAGRVLSPVDRDAVLVSQAVACRKSLLWMGMTNPPFIDYLRALSPTGEAKVATAARSMA